MTFSWAKNHFCIDSPFPSDFLAALRTKFEAELDSSGLETWPSEPGSGDSGDGEGDSIISSPSPFLTSEGSLCSTWTQSKHARLTTTTLQPQPYNCNIIFNTTQFNSVTITTTTMSHVVAVNTAPLSDDHDRQLVSGDTHHEYHCLNGANSTLSNFKSNEHVYSPQKADTE